MTEHKPLPVTETPRSARTASSWLRWAAIVVAASVVVASAAAAWEGAGLFDSEQDEVVKGAVSFWLAQQKFRRITGRYFSAEDLTPERLDDTILRVFHDATGSWPELRVLPNDGGWAMSVRSGSMTYVLRGDAGLTLYRTPGAVDPAQLAALATAPPTGWEETRVPAHLLLADGLWILSHCPAPEGGTPTPPLIGPGPRYKSGSGSAEEDSN